MATSVYSSEIAIQRYLNRIRNLGKHRYACAYARHLRTGSAAPDRQDFGISLMAAQAVEIRLRELIEPSARFVADLDRMLRS